MIRRDLRGALRGLRGGFLQRRGISRFCGKLRPTALLFVACRQVTAGDPFRRVGKALCLSFRVRKVVP